ncbi:MAG: hypothetical protein Ct9H300mP9_8240 [Candidatus Neomarinimicrobiota bacterium]|nr:MAG: hypothetical protein Ct9H300mP9_8240 [Candidatus Neomarinimicrobiota bacterium]
MGVCFFSPIKHGLLTGKYKDVASFPDGDFRQTVQEFQDIDFIKRMRINMSLLEKRFVNHPEPVLHGLLGALLTGSSTGCVLLGQRNQEQVSAIKDLGIPLNDDNAAWVFSLYEK